MTVKGADSIQLLCIQHVSFSVPRMLPILRRSDAAVESPNLAAVDAKSIANLSVVSKLDIIG